MNISEPKILITAFEPFGNETKNASMEVLKGLPYLPGMKITKLYVPVIFGKAEETVFAAMSRDSYDAVIMLGEAGGRSEITPEIRAVNKDDARIPDNAGNKPSGHPVDEHGKPEYLSSLPVMECVLQMRRNYIPASLSGSAGTFVCNHLMYKVLQKIDAEGLHIKAGFIHIPYLDLQEHEDLPSVPFQTAVRGIAECVKAAARSIDPPADQRELTLHPIAVIHTDLTSKFGVPRQAGLAENLTGTVVFEKEYRDLQAFRGLEGFSHLWLIWGFSENETGKWSPTVRPPRLGGNERMGVFATRSPFRPNPLGLSAVKIKKLRNTAEYGPVIDVAGADLTDGTPIYDIKPYIAYADSIPDAKSGFASAKSAEIPVIFPEKLKGILPADKELALEEILAQDPRPHYQNDTERIYGFPYAGYEVRFRYTGDALELKDLEKIKDE